MAEKFDSLYDDEELLHPSTKLLQTCDSSFIKGSRAFAYRLKASRVLERLIPAQRKIYGEEDMLHTRSIFDLASIRVQQGLYDVAEVPLHLLFKLWQRMLGPEHRYTLKMIDLILDCMLRRRKLDEAEVMFKKRLVLNSLDLLYKRQGKLKTAHHTFLDAVSTMERHSDTDDSNLSIVLASLGSVHGELSEEGEEEATWTRVFDVGGLFGGWVGEHPHIIKAIE
ncbi:MAG: hypothetical protein Q9181_007074 [Wetmoreana brouardii]